MERCIMKRKDIQKEIERVFGESYKFMSMERILGGAQKGTYKIVCTNQFTFVLYIWDESCSYFVNSNSEGFTSNSATHFKINQNILKVNGISTPDIYNVDISKSKYAFEYAFVEYIKGSELEVLLYNDKQITNEMLFDLRNNIEKMHGIKNDYVGDLLHSKNIDFRCEDYIQNELSKELDYLFNNYEKINKMEDRIITVSNMLYQKIESRKEYSLIHWELGPNHVMVNESNKTFLIDIEGMKYFDLEYEHSFLELRFGDYYKYLKRNDLDENRMLFYRFYHHISCIAGAHQLLKNDYYDVVEVKGMISYNYKKVKEFL